MQRFTGFLVGFLFGAWSMVADWRFWLAVLIVLLIEVVCSAKAQRQARH